MSIKQIAHSKRLARGQGMTEYIIIVALIAIAGIAAYSMFGKTMQGAVADVGTELSGRASTKVAASKSDTLTTKASEDERNMGTFGDDQKH